MEEIPTAMTPLLPKLEKSKYHSLLSVVFGFLLTLTLTFFACAFLSLNKQKPKYILAKDSITVREADHLKIVNVSRMWYYQSKLMPSSENIVVQTPWLAPIVWDGTFQIAILNQQFRLQNVSIGLVVFATGKYVAFLKVFLQSAEMYFMEGHRVKYYIFTDQPVSMPSLKPSKGRQMVILETQGSAHPRNTYIYRMEAISYFSQGRFAKEVDYLVCAHVNIIFCNSVGVEILSSLFGTLHPLFFGLPRKSLAYERQPQSQAYISEDEGDFYYSGAFFGGKVLEVHRLTKFCYQAMRMDQADRIHVVRHDESYLNKYLLYNKPTKVLSPEYMWNRKLLNTHSFQGVLANGEMLVKVSKYPWTDAKQDFQRDLRLGHHHGKKSEKLVC
ncbi:histo-blood group ABO system transferase-like [Mesocricetus auratus]|uniref:Histo-blood group ABO system transferase-like n=1 Tax=Mesocricetus auratus TaxID=10036 RepID=A0ABM2WKZ3_MESAU|nr:histo-blood group ABO system transferase-like [Mesocricetus auratus]